MCAPTMSEVSSVHVPVLAEEVLQWLEPRPGSVVVDGTLGGGGHTRLLAQQVGDAGSVIAIDRDPAAIDLAEQRLAGLPVRLVQANYRDLPEVLKALEIETVDAILLDLGLSSDQLADPKRGFSFSGTGTLDLRFDPTAGEPTWRWLNRLGPTDLATILRTYGEERFSRRIASAIVERRQSPKGPIRTAAELAELIRRCVPSGGHDRIDPATRTFQALRIASNEELKSLEIALRRLPECLKPDGRLAVISFHSLEDRRAKAAFRDDPRWETLTKKPIRPTDAEIESNPRSRSAKLRVAARIQTAVTKAEPMEEE
ncbi:MAG: 16S rRNA (cytosine(1402)-N(4))-methyltransferase RsmH [Pirellulales bacterium]|nr:16S rRNA (cytosine(1402)-N(4))-methyltransferase RsmH [Pirellulales bacterium]